jgi:hypothetical protein
MHNAYTMLHPSPAPAPAPSPGPRPAPGPGPADARALTGPGITWYSIHLNTNYDVVEAVNQ